MIQQRIDGVLAAIHQIHHAFGQTGLVEQFKRALHRERHALRRLQEQTYCRSAIA